MCVPTILGLCDVYTLSVSTTCIMVGVNWTFGVCNHKIICENHIMIVWNAYLIFCSVHVCMCPLLNNIDYSLYLHIVLLSISLRILFSVQSVLVYCLVLLWVWLPSLMHMKLWFEMLTAIALTMTTTTAAYIQLQSLVKLQL